MSRNSLGRKLGSKYIATCIETFLTSSKIPDSLLIGDKISLRRVTLPDSTILTIISKLGEKCGIIIRAVKSKKSGKIRVVLSLVTTSRDLEDLPCFREVFEAVVGTCRAVELYCFDNVREVPKSLVELGRETIVQLVENVRSLTNSDKGKLN